MTSPRRQIVDPSVAGYDTASRAACVVPSSAAKTSTPAAATNIARPGWRIRCSPWPAPSVQPVAFLRLPVSRPHAVRLCVGSLSALAPRGLNPRSTRDPRRQAAQAGPAPDAASSQPGLAGGLGQAVQWFAERPAREPLPDAWTARLGSSGRGLRRDRAPLRCAGPCAAQSRSAVHPPGSPPRRQLLLRASRGCAWARPAVC